jgi:hypothetical protein
MLHVSWIRKDMVVEFDNDNNAVSIEENQKTKVNYAVPPDYTFIIMKLYPSQKSETQPAGRVRNYGCK